MRIFFTLVLLPFLANAASPQTVRTISALEQPASSAMADCVGNGGRPVNVIRSISTTSEAVISAVAVGECLAAAPSNPDGTYPAARPAKHSASSAPRRRKLPEENEQISTCVAKAADVFHVEKSALYLILDVEGGTLGQTSAPNKDGSVDIGPMQVNEWWVSKLEARGISRDELTNNLCINIMAGAWIYAQERRNSKTVAEAIARYHSPAPLHQRVYLGLIEQAIDRRLQLKPATPETVSPCAIGSTTCNVSSTSSSDTSPKPPVSAPISSGT